MNYLPCNDIDLFGNIKMFEIYNFDRDWRSWKGEFYFNLLSLKNEKIEVLFKINKTIEIPHLLKFNIPPYWFSVEVYVTGTDGVTWGKYNPTCKRHKCEAEFEWYLFPSDENMKKILLEIWRQANEEDY